MIGLAKDMGGTPTVDTIEAACKWEHDHTEFKIYRGSDLLNMQFPDDGTPEWKGGLVTWEQVSDLVPELKLMLKLAKSIRRPKGPWCSNNMWYAIFKPRLCELVGDGCPRKNPMLRSSEAYDIAYKTIYDALPPCRDCLCA